MTEIPWWLYSPSIFSVIQIGILTLVGLYWLREGPYKSRIQSLMMSFITACFMMVIFDIFYCLFIMARFLPQYPQDFQLMSISVARDITATVLFYFLPWKLWQRKYLSFNKISWLIFSFNLVFLATWIGLAPNLNWVNAQQAYVNQPEVLWTTIILGHGVGRILNTSFWISLWRHP